MHTYSCAECGNKFQTEHHVSRCPICGCKVLIHLEGEPRRAKSCSRRECGGGCSCGGGCRG